MKDDVIKCYYCLALRRICLESNLPTASPAWYHIQFRPVELKLYVNIHTDVACFKSIFIYVQCIYSNRLT